MHHTCALSATGGVYCWGNNGNGQLGNNSTRVATFRSGRGGGRQRASIRHREHRRQLLPHLRAERDGRGSTAGATTATVSSGTTRPRVATSLFRSLGSGGPGFCPASRTSPRACATTPCAVTTTGGVYCWGYNGDGELGNNSTAQQATSRFRCGVGAPGSCLASRHRCGREHLRGDNDGRGVLLGLQQLR